MNDGLLTTFGWKILLLLFPPAAAHLFSTVTTAFPGPARTIDVGSSGIFFSVERSL